LAESEFDKLPEMTHYVLGLFRRVPNRPALSDEETNRIQEGHMANLRCLTEDRDLIACGPFEEDGELRGMMVFSTGSIERARDLMKNDPAMVAGRLSLELFTWFGPAGLTVIPPASRAAGHDR
jgi:uncharacterized protein